MKRLLLAAARERTVERFAWNRVFEDLGSVYAEVSGEAAFARPGV